MCDQGSNNRSLFQKLGVTVKQPYFTHNGKEIIVFFDPPHLLKNIRNNMKRTGYIVNGDAVSWDHIQALFARDRSDRWRLCHKLTEAHIDIPPLKQMKVSLAAQVLSHSVSAAIKHMVNSGDLPKQTLATSDFCENFDILFNCFNSITFDDGHEFRRPITKKSGQLAWLKSTRRWLNSIKVPTGRSLHCVEGWKLNIAALGRLWECLRKEHPVKVITNNT